MIEFISQEKSLHQLALLFRPLYQMAIIDKSLISQKETETALEILTETQIIHQETESENDNESVEDEEFETCPESYLLIEPFDEKFSFSELEKIVEFFDSEEERFRYVIINHDSNMGRWLSEIEPFFHWLKDKKIEELFIFGLENSVCKDTILSSLWTQTDEIFSQLKNLNNNYNTEMTDCRISIERIISERQKEFEKVDDFIIKLNESYLLNGAPNLETAKELQSILEKVISLRLKLEEATQHCYEIIEKKQELHLQNIEMLKEIQNNTKTKADEDESEQEYSSQSELYEEPEESQQSEEEGVLNKEQERSEVEEWEQE